jgi:hypothetical protein
MMNTTRLPAVILVYPWQIILLPEPVHGVDWLQHMWLWLGAHSTQGPHTVRNALEVSDM